MSDSSVPAGRVRVTQVASGLGRKKDQIQTLTGLGLGKLRRTRELEDTPSVRGMVHAIHHMVQMWDGDTLVYDGTKVRKKATRKGRKPSEKRGADK